MTSDMKKLVEENNAKPLFYREGLTIYQRGRMTLKEDGSASVGMSFPICEISEYITDPEQVLELLLKGSSAP